MTLVCADKEACDERFSLVYEMTYDEIRKYASCRCGDPQHLPRSASGDLSRILPHIKTQGLCLRPRRQGASHEDRLPPRHAVLYAEAADKAACADSGAGENGSVTDTDIPDPFSLEDAVITAEESGNIAREISHLPAETRKIIYLYYARI